MLSRASFQQIPEDRVLGESLFFADGLLIYVLCDPSVGMTEQLLGCFDVYPFLPQNRRQSMPELMPANLFLDSNPFQGWPDMTPKDHVRLNGLGSISLALVQTSNRRNRGLVTLV